MNTEITTEFMQITSEFMEVTNEHIEIYSQIIGPIVDRLEKVENTLKELQNEPERS